MALRQCEGITNSGSQCKRRIRDCERYCVVHNISTNIALPSYVSVTAEDRFWIFFPENQAWRVGSEFGSRVFCPGSGAVYMLDSYVSEGTYGAVYFGTRLYDDRPVAVKVFKEVYHKRSPRSALDYDFMKEYYMHRAVADRVSSECVVKMLDTFFVRTKNGLHGAIVMEKMDGCLLDLFENFAYLSSKLHLEAFRLWVIACRSIASALLDLHAHKIYHLDIKPGNVLYARAPTSEGIVMKLVDLGLSCYIGGTPIVPCVATGSYLPPEWRENGNKREPTYAHIKDRSVLEMGEIYAMCVTFSKMLKYIHIGVLRDSKNLTGLLHAIEQGKNEKRSARYSLTTKVFVDLATSLLEELNDIMPPPRLSKLLHDMS